MVTLLLYFSTPKVLTEAEASGVMTCFISINYTSDFIIAKGGGGGGGIK